MDNNTSPALAPAALAGLATICSRLRPDAVDGMRAAILAAITRQFGQTPEPAAVVRFLDDIRVAQEMSGIDIDYAEHYTHMHQAGVDFMRLVQAVKAADKDYK